MDNFSLKTGKKTENYFCCSLICKERHFSVLRAVKCAVPKAVCCSPGQAVKNFIL